MFFVTAGELRQKRSTMYNVEGLRRIADIWKTYFSIPLPKANFIENKRKAQKLSEVLSHKYSHVPVCMAWAKQKTTADCTHYGRTTIPQKKKKFLINI